MNLARRWRIGGAIAAVLLVAAAVIAGGAERRQSEEAGVAPSLPVRGSEETPPEKSDEGWEAVLGLRLAGSSFDADSVEPLALYRNEKSGQALVVRKGEIFFEKKGKSEGDSLFRLPSGVGAVRYWTLGDALLIGSDSGRNAPRGEWRSVRMRDGAAPETLKIEGASVDPADVVAVTGASDPALFLISIAEDGRDYEMAYRPGDKELVFVNAYEGIETGYAFEVYRNSRPKPADELQSFRRSIDGGSEGERWLRAYEDERGTLVAAVLEGGGFGVARYPAQRVEALQWKKGELGDRMPMVRLKGDRSGRDSHVLPFVGWALEGIPDLFEDKWRMIDSLRFYASGLDGEIETVRYQWQEDRVVPERHRVVVGRSPEREEAGLLTYRFEDGMARSLSVYDLMSGSGNGDLPWLEEPPTIVPSEDKRDLWSDVRKPFKVPQAALDMAWRTEEAPEAVVRAKEAENAAGDACIFDCDPDYSALVPYRSIEGEWHTFLGTQLLRLRGDRFERLGEWPITIRYLSGEGANGYYPRDFLKADGYWYLADTYADRILKLDDAGGIVGETALPLPVGIESAGNGQIRAVSLRGKTLIDTGEMKAVGKPAATGWEKVGASANAWTEAELAAGQIYEDPDTGYRWHALGGYAFVVDGSGKGAKLMSHFIGYPESGRTLPKIVAYGDAVYAISDHRAEKFGKDGRWISSIAYPEGDPACYRQATGEGSSSFDAGSGDVYWVHRCEVYRIDLDAGTATVVFAQREAGIGALAVSGDSVVFSLEGNSEYSETYPAKHSNELVRLDRDTGLLTRYRLEKGWTSGLTSGTAEKDGRIGLWYTTAYGGNPRYGTVSLGN